MAEPFTVVARGTDARGVDHVTDADRAELRGQPIDAFGGWGHVTRLENDDFAGVLARWQPPA